MKTQLDRDLASLEKIIAGLFVSLKQDIADDYRAGDDPDDNTPGMQVTIGFTPASEHKPYSWAYQTGDNSYSGGAYGHPHWGVVSLYRRSNSRELAKECVDQIGELCCSEPTHPMKATLETQVGPPFVMKCYTASMTGALVAKCPHCGMVCAYWEQEDLDENGNLLCYCPELDKGN